MAQINALEQLREALSSQLGTGLQNLTHNKLNEMTSRQPRNPLFDIQQSPGQQTLQSLLGGGQTVSPITPESKDILEALQQFQPKQIEQPDIINQKIANPKKEIKEGKAVKLTPAIIKQQKKDELAQKKQDILLEREKSKSDRLEQTALRKEKKSYIDKINANHEVADEADLVINKMESLIDKGGLPIAGFYKLFDSLEKNVNPGVAGPLGAAAGTYLGGPVGALIGGGIGALISPVATALKYAQRQTSPNTEEFEKLSASFLKQAKAIFGNRITNTDLEYFMKTVPTLAQTDSGKRAIIKNMKTFNKAAQIRYKAYKDIIKENDNRIPADLEFQVEDRAKPELDKLAKDFVI